jgi:DNA-binding response OmpR family regulator
VAPYQEVGDDQQMSSAGTPSPAGATGPVSTILLYASDRLTRENVRLALGRRVARDLPEVRVVEVATQPAVIAAMDAGGVDLAILDGEAVPGGMGLCRQLKDEVFDCPPVLVLTGRLDDAWLATWSRADGVLAHPVDPMRLPDVVAGLLRASAPSAAQG